MSICIASNLGEILRSTLRLDMLIFIARRRGPPALPSSHLPPLFVDGMVAPLRQHPSNNWLCMPSKSMMSTPFGGIMSAISCTAPFVSSAFTLGKGFLTMLGIGLRFVGTM